MQYGFKAHAVKHEPIIALQLLERTIEWGLQLRFTRLNWRMRIG